MGRYRICGEVWILYLRESHRYLTQGVETQARARLAAAVTNLGIVYLINQAWLALENISAYL